jgi:hypothetical protein
MKIKHLRIILFVLLLVFLSIFISDRNWELFNSQFMNDNRKKIGVHSVVDVYDNLKPDAYDLNLEGPKCLATCVMEHVPNINWSNPNNTDNILEFNKGNPNKGYCYRANDDEFPFKCGVDCIEKCKKGGSDLGNYEFNNDFSQCDISDKYGCIEKRLNISSGNSLLNSTGCKDCINKYHKNINQLIKIYEDELNQNDTCKSE